MISQQQIPKQSKTQKMTSSTTETKITGDSNHCSLISPNINGLNLPIKRHRLTDWIGKQNPSFFCIQETHLNLKDTSSQSKGLGKYTNQMDLRNKQV